MPDSRPDTYEHQATVRGLLNLVVHDLLDRGHWHDFSKLQSPELEWFDQGQKLKGLEYGTEEYRAQLDAMRPALDHHYEFNDHHPEHWEQGIEEMTLFEITEMLCDWIAACRRTKDGDIFKSIEYNATRFGYGDEIKGLLKRTATRLLRMETYGHDAY